MYCRKIATYVQNDKLLIHYFQDSLSSPASCWYMLESAHVCSWKKLVDSFLKQYKHNIDMAYDRLDLQMMEKKSTESFKEYAQRWRDKAAQVQPPLIDKELFAMFINTLKHTFYDRTIGSSSTNFLDIITIGERIKYRVKHGRITYTAGESSTRRKQVLLKRKKKKYKW